jgi:hypothetical protein
MTEADKIVRLASLLDQRTPEPAPPAINAVTIPVTASDARQAGGTDSDAFNAKIVREAIAASACHDIEGAAAEALAALRDNAPLNAREAMIAAQLVATHAACMDSYQLGRLANGPHRDMLLGQAGKLSRTHAILSETLDRARGRERQVAVFEYRRGPALPPAWGGQITSWTSARRGRSRQGSSAVVR